MLSGELLVFSRLEDPPSVPSMDREDFRRIGNKTNDTIPVTAGGVVVDALMFDAIRFEKDWSNQEVQRLKLVAEIFGNAFERERGKQGFAGSQKICA